MSDGLRTLPPWMAKSGGKVKKEPLKSKRKRKTARAAFYLMNEKELVEAAVSFLTDASCHDVTEQKVEDEAEETTVRRKENPAATPETVAEPLAEPLEKSSLDSGDDLEATYVSESDLDITEVETLPYTGSPQHQGPEGQRSGPAQGQGGVVKAELEAEKKHEHSQLPADAAEEDDALRLVREIFFT